MSVLRAKPRNLLSWCFDVYDGREHLTTIDTAWFGERGDFLMDGRAYQVRKLGVFSGHFVLRADGQTIAEAQKDSAFRRSFTVSWGGETMTLSAAHALTRRFVLERDAVNAGEVVPDSIISRKLTATFPDDLTRPVRLFLLFLVIVLWRRQQANSSS